MYRFLEMRYGIPWHCLLVNFSCIRRKCKDTTNLNNDIAKHETKMVSNLSWEWHINSHRHHACEEATVECRNKTSSIRIGKDEGNLIATIKENKELICGCVGAASPGRPGVWLGCVWVFLSLSALTWVSLKETHVLWRHFDKFLNGASFRLTQWLKRIPHVIRSYYRCCYINERAIFSVVTN